MFHEPAKQFFYSAYKVEAEYLDDLGTSKIIIATAFIIEVEESVPWIVTNRHVVDLDYKQVTAKYKDFNLNKFIITGRRSDDSVYSFRLHENAKMYFHEDKNNDVVLIQARVYFDKGKKFHWHFGMEHLADEEIFTTIDPFDLVCYTGFPDQHDKLGDRPIIRSGHIASDPNYDYSWNSKSQGKCVAYEGFSSGGASGGPIFSPPRGMSNIPNSRHGYLIGINAGHIPGSDGHSGISYFYKSTVILNIIEKNKLRNMINDCGA